MVRLGALSRPDDAGARATSARAAPDVNRFVIASSARSRRPADPALAARSATRRSSAARRSSRRGRSCRTSARFAERRAPLVGEPRELADESCATPAASSGAMDYLFFQVAAINGFDSVGHYLRARADRQRVLDVRDRPRRRTAARTSQDAGHATRRSASGATTRGARSRRPERGRARNGARRAPRAGQRADADAGAGHSATLARRRGPTGAAPPRRSGRPARRRPRVRSRGRAASRGADAPRRRRRRRRPGDGALLDYLLGGG